MKRLHLLFFLIVTQIFFSVGTIPADVTDIIAASKKAGAYREDITLFFYPYRDSTVLYYRIEESESTNKVLYTTPLELSAMPGEERTYSISVEARNEDTLLHTSSFTYTIDTLAPEPPELMGLNESTTEMVLTQGLEKLIAFDETPTDLTFLSRKDEKIFYTLENSFNKGMSLWQGETIPLHKKMNNGKIRLSAYSQDEAGNKSGLVSWDFIVTEKTSSSPGTIEIKSPINGSFYNSQMLYVTHNNCENIQYALRDKNGKTVNSGKYTEPIMLNYTGVLTLYVWGRERGTGELIEKTVQFTVLSGGGAPPLTVSSGVYVSPLTLQPVRGSETNRKDPYKISFDKGEHYNDFSSPLSINSIRGALYYTSIMIKRSSQDTGPVWRYSFLLDDKPVPVPEIVGQKKTRLNGKTKIYILGPVDCDIYYTVDGTTPDINSKKYNGPFEINLPKNVANGSLSVKAKAFRFTGKESAQSTEIFFFDMKAPAPPLVNILNNNKKGTLVISVTSEPETSLVYTLSYSSDPPEDPKITSPSMPATMELSLPRGMEKSFTLKVAAIDKAGNISPSSLPITLTIDRTPHSPPEIHMVETASTGNEAGGSLSDEVTKSFELSGDGNMYYFVKKMPYSSTKFIDDQLYTGPFTLKGEKGRLTDYYIFTYSLDELGNNSGYRGPNRFFIDDRDPQEDLSFTIEDGAVYRGKEKYIHFMSPYSDLVFHYTLGRNGRIPEDPTIASPRAEKELYIEGDKGEETRVAVKVLPHFRKSGHIGKIIEFECILDDKPPPPPILTGIYGDLGNGATTNRGQLLMASCKESTAEVFVSISTTGQTDPIEAGRKVENRFLVDAEIGEEKRFIINAVSRDKAGNLTYLEEPLTLLIDRKPPEAPIPVGAPPSGVSNTDVEITLVEEDKGDIYYAISKDGSMPQMHYTKEELYEGPFFVKGEEDKETRITIISAAIDEAGNTSPRKRVTRFTIDKKPPLSEASIIVHALDQNRWRISWKSPQDAETILYKVPGENTFTPYTAPVEVSLNKSGFIQYYLIDRAGNKGPLFQYPITTVPSPTLDISGVNDGGIYKSEKNITFSSSGTVRYEISYDQDPVKEVTFFSPEAPKTLLMDVPKGETRKVNISAKAFPSYKARTGFKEQRISFTLDKTPPIAPEIIGVTPGMTYMEAIPVTLSVPEGKAYLRVTKEFSHKNIDGEVAFLEDPEKLLLECPIGDVVSYTLAAYSVDEAGNTSSEETQVTCIIDRKHLHVYPETVLKGKRDVDTPIMSIEEGVELAKESGRTTILLASGVYSVKEPIYIDSPIEIRGTMEGNITSIKDIPTMTLSPDFRGPIFRVGPKGELKLEGLHIYGPTLQGRDIPLFELSKGSISFEKGLVTLEKENPGSIIQQHLGNFSLTSITVEAAEVPTASLFRCNGGITHIEDSSIIVEKTREIFSLFTLKGGADSAFINSKVQLENGDNSKIIKGSNCTVSMDRSEFILNNSKDRSTALEIENGRVDIQKSSITTKGKSEISIPLHITGTSLSMADTQCESYGDGGVIPIMVKNSFIDLKDTNFSGRGGRDFMYLFMADGVRGSLEGCTLTSNSTVESKGFVLTDSTIEFIRSTLLTGGGTAVHLGFEVDAQSRLEIQSSTIQSGKDYPGGTAIMLGKVPNNENDYISVKDSVFSGWNALADGAVEAFSIEELNFLDKKKYGGFIDGNTVE